MLPPSTARGEGLRMWWMGREGPSFSSLESQEATCFHEDFCRPRSSWVPPHCSFFTHLTAFLPMCTMVMLLLKQTSIPTRCIPKARSRPGAKWQLSCGWEQRSPPSPGLAASPKKSRYQTLFLGERNKMHLISLLLRWEKYPLRDFSLYPVVLKEIPEATESR